MEYPKIDPIAVSVGPLEIHWYGVMYLCAFLGAWFLGRYRAGRPGAVLNKAQIEDMVFYGAMGIVIGGRFGYVFLYNFSYFLEDPLWLFRIWEGGMAFHGGLVGVITAMVLYARKLKISFLSLMDFVAPLVPLGLGFGRVGNFIGGELWGRETTVDWGMVFPKDSYQLVRHPSQLYQAFLEGIVLFAIVWWFSSKPRPKASVSAVFLIVYGCQRFFVEFYRQPDAHINYDLFDWMTRGQLLSIPMILVGMGVFWWSYQQQSPEISPKRKK